MARLSQAKVAVVLWISLWAICAARAGAAAGPAPVAGNPLTVVPADVLFCVQIKNLSGAMMQIDQFLTGVSPIGVSMLVPAQLAKFLGGTEPKGINMSGDYAAFGPLPGGDKPDPSRIGVLVPISDYKLFTGGNPNVTPPDAAGISAIGPKEQPMFVAANVAGYALVTSVANRPALIETKKLLAGAGAGSLAKRLSPDELKRAQASAIWAYANMQTASKMFGPMIQAKLQEAKKAMQDQATAGMMPGLTQAGGVMDMYGGLLNTLMQETQSVSLSLDPSAGAIRLGLAVAAVPNTETAKLLQGTPQTPDKKFLQYLENGAIMNVITATDPAAWTRMNNFYIDLLAKFTGKDPAGAEVSSLRRLATDSANALGGTAAVSFSAEAGAKPPFRLQYVVGLKDPQAFYRAMDQAPKICESGLVADLLKTMGMKLSMEIKRKAETYKDVPIDTFKFAIKGTDPNSPQSQMMATIYGQGTEGRIAVVNNLLVYAIAKDSSASVRKLIDQVKGGAAQPVAGEVQAAMPLIPGAEKACFFGTYNYLRVLQMATAFLPMPVPQTAVQSQSNIAFAGKAAGGNLSIDLAVPKQHLMEIIGVFMQMQQQKMQQPEQPKSQT